MDITKFEKARLFFRKILEENVEAEVFLMLREYYNPNKLEYEVLYDTGERSFVLKPGTRIRRGQLVVGVVINDVALSLREGLMTCNWYQAREYSRLDSCVGGEMMLLPVDLKLEKILDSLNRQLEYLGGDPLSFGWYWTNYKINDHQALAVEMRTGMLKAFDVKSHLRYRTCYRLLQDKDIKKERLFFAYEENDD